MDRTDHPTRLDLATHFAQVRFGHMMALGLSFVANGDDWCELALDYDRRLTSDLATGIVASGPIVSLMDTAANAAIWCRCGAIRAQVTLDLRVDYLRPALPGRRIVGRVQCYRLTRSVAFVRGEAHDGDPADPVAQVAGSFLRTGGADL